MLRRVMRWADPKVMDAGGSGVTTAVEDPPPGQHPNIVTSVLDDGTERHVPTLDIDWPVTVVPSSTPGHFHLYIDCPMTKGEYEDLIETMGAVGLLGSGYVEHSLKRGHTALRVPWLTKEEPGPVKERF